MRITNPWPNLTDDFVDGNALPGTNNILTSKSAIFLWASVLFSTTRDLQYQRCGLECLEQQAARQALMVQILLQKQIGNNEKESTSSLMSSLVFQAIENQGKLEKDTYFSWFLLHSIPPHFLT